MTLEEILSMWEKDCIIDPTELKDESLKIPNLHSKYYSVFAKERLKLKQLQEDMKIFRIQKYEFYHHGPHEDTPDDWELPPQGVIRLKTDVQQYVDADKHIIEKNLQIAYQQEKVSALEEIIKTLNTRNFIIKNAIDWHKFTNGG